MVNSKCCVEHRKNEEEMGGVGGGGGCSLQPSCNIYKWIQQDQEIRVGTHSAGGVWEDKSDESLNANSLKQPNGANNTEKKQIGGGVHNTCRILERLTDI